MPDPRDLLAIPDAEIEARLARVIGWRERPHRIWKAGQKLVYGPPAYCSESSPRSLLGDVEARIFKDHALALQYTVALSDSAPGPMIIASAAIRARAALWVLEERKDA